MTPEELVALVADVRERQSELEAVEVKSARGGTPKRLYEALSALANRTGGGVILLGLDEERDFAVAGVGDAQRLQEEISSVAAEMEPALRPEFTVGEVEGRTVVAIEVVDVAPELRPCHYKPAGLQKGSYIRVGNTNRQMTDYEIYGYVSARGQPTFDEEPIVRAGLDDLDRPALDEYVRRLRRAQPRAADFAQPFEDVLKQLGVVRDAEGTLRPTLAGLLVFGRYPHQFEPQLVITFLQFYGTSDTEPAPGGRRFLDNQKFEGAVPEIIDRAVIHVMGSVRKSSLIEGVYRRDIPEYPEEAVREAVVNAVAHRDYSGFARGSYIQIRLFADRLEVHSPGGLYGRVTEETLEEEHSTRNRLLMRLMEDLRLVENRGSGIRIMIAALRKANLEPPRFQDRRVSFRVIFHSHTLMSPEAVAWLNQFADRPLNDGQRVALAYLRQHERVTNGEYRRLNHVDRDAATRDLRGLVRVGLIDQHGTRGGAYYTMRVIGEVPAPKTDEEKILAVVRERGSISNAECRAVLGNATKDTAYGVLKSLCDKHLLRLGGERRWARYRLP